MAGPPPLEKRLHALAGEPNNTVFQALGPVRFSERSWGLRQRKTIITDLAVAREGKWVTISIVGGDTQLYFTLRPEEARHLSGVLAKAAAKRAARSDNRAAPKSYRSSQSRPRPYRPRDRRRGPGAAAKALPAGASKTSRRVRQLSRRSQG
ncbi:MAG: hypothetical protein ACREHV_01025 [Rhizomicrobium sp.]